MFGGRQKSAPAGYTPATRIGPEWTTGYLVYQGGVPYRPVASLTGGGHCVGKDWIGKQPPMIVANVSAIVSAVGSGVFPARTYFAAPLAGGDGSTGNM